MPQKPFYGPPVFILFEDRLIVCAEPSKEGAKYVQPILFKHDSNEGKILKPVDEQTFNELKKNKGIKYYSIRLPEI